MALCIYAKEDNCQNFVTVDNLFITSFMKDCNEVQLKVYLFGLHLCSLPLSRDNSLSYMSESLGLTEKDIIDAFNFWQEQGLVTVYSEKDLQIQYHSPRNRTHFKEYKNEKYHDFNAQLDSIFSGKQTIMPNQYLQYYDFIEASGINPNALILIIGHCVNIKGSSVSHNYLLQVAKNWVNDGIRTEDQVSSRIQERERNSGILREIAAAIGKTSSVSEEDKDLYYKWTNTWGYDDAAILAASKKSLKSFTKLDALLDECFNNSAYDALEIENFLKKKKKLTNCAIQVANSLGIWVSNISPVLAEFVSPWSDKGYSVESIELIAKFCFANSMRDFSLMNSFIEKLYAENVISDENVTGFFKNIELLNTQIEKLLKCIGSSRIVTPSDRSYYKTWTSTWGFSAEAIEYVALQNISKPFAEIGKRLSILKQKNLISYDEIKKYYEVNKNASSAVAKFNEVDKKYSKDELASHFTDKNKIDEVEF